MSYTNVSAENLIDGLPNAAACALPTNIVGQDVGLVSRKFGALFPVTSEAAARPTLPVTVITSAAANVDLANGLSFRDGDDIFWITGANPAGCGVYTQAFKRTYFAYFTGNSNFLVPPSTTIPMTFNSAPTVAGFVTTNFAAGTVTINVTGSYRISATAFAQPPFTLVTGNGMELYVQVNGAFITDGQLDQDKNLTNGNVVSLITFLHCNGTITIRLNAGDVVRTMVGCSDPLQTLTVTNRNFMIERV